MKSRGISKYRNLAEIRLYEEASKLGREYRRAQRDFEMKNGNSRYQLFEVSTLLIESEFEGKMSPSG